MRVCTKCGESKSESEFYKHKTGRDGLHPHCKSCFLASQKRYREENAELVREQKRAERLRNAGAKRARDKAYYEANKERERAKRREWYSKNADLVKAKVRDWQEANPDRTKANRRASKARNVDSIRAEYERNKHQYFDRAAKRRVKVKEVTPSWSDEAQVRQIYKTCQNLNRMFPMLEFHVDHVVPLVNDAVCGLHSHTNLQILVGEENLSKGNRHWPDMP